MTDFKFTPEDFNQCGLLSRDRACRIANAKLEEHKSKLSIPGYTISMFSDNAFWFEKDDGEGMAISQEAMDRMWKECF
jgi:hypothetical protein